jgi:hypothetical protein
MSITIPILTDFDGKGIQKAVAEFKKLETNGQKAQYALKKAAVPAAAALAGLSVAAVDFAKAAAEDATGAAKLANQLKNSTLATDKQIESVEKWITITSMAAAVADDELRPALAKLATATGSITLSQQLMTTALDVAAATGKSVVDVADALSKGYAGNLKGLKALSPELAAMIKDHATFDQVVTRLNENYKNAARIQANSAEGGFKKMQIALQEAKESIGAQLLPVIQKMATLFADFGVWAQGHSDTILVLGTVLGTVAASIVAINAAIKIYNALAAVTQAVNAALAASFTVLQVATGAAVIVALIAAFVLLQKKFDIIGKSVNAVKDAVNFLWQDVFKPFGEFIGNGLAVYFDALKLEFNAIKTVVEVVGNAIKNAFQAAFKFVAEIWNNTVGKLNFKIPGWVPGIGGKEFGVPTIPTFANGGIVTGPTVGLIGEAGPEAIIPLSRANNVASNYTINVHGGDPNAVVDALRKYQRQNGAIPIAVSG